MKKEFVPHTQALALKELGFDEPCIGYYIETGEWIPASYSREGTVYPSNTDLLPEWCAAPIYQQAFRWIREKHNHVGFIQIVEPEYGGEYGYVIYYNPNHLSVHHWNKGFKTYEEAESACLDKLIEIVKDEKQK